MKHREHKRSILGLTELHRPMQKPNTTVIFFKIMRLFDSCVFQCCLCFVLLFKSSLNSKELNVNCVFLQAVVGSSNPTGTTVLTIIYMVLGHKCNFSSSSLLQFAGLVNLKLTKLTITFATLYSD